MFFHLAGEKIYTRVEIGHVIGWNDIMRGAEIATTTPKRFENDGPRSGYSTRPMKTNYKQLLLEYVNTIVLRDHACPGVTSASVDRVEATANMMTGLKRVIMAPKAGCASISGNFSYAFKSCRFATHSNYESLSIHSCNLVTLRHGHWEPFSLALDTVQHATLVISPTRISLKDSGPPVNGRDEGPPMKLESFRLIFAGDSLNEFSIVPPIPLVSMECLLKSVASCLKLGNWKIEIYIFDDFKNTLDLVDFRKKLKIEVDDAIKALPKKDRPDWSPDYQVFGLEDYFDHPDMYLELDHEWMMSWKRELDRRQRAQREEEKRIVEFGKVGNLAELPVQTIDDQDETRLEQEGTDGQEALDWDHSPVVTSDDDGGES
jgi:hypothetical protein